MDEGFSHRFRTRGIARPESAKLLYDAREAQRATNLRA